MHTGAFKWDLPCSKTDFTPAVCRVGLRQLPTQKHLREKQHITVASSFPKMIFALTFLSTFNYSQLKFALTSTPAFLLGNSRILPHFILCFPCPSLICPQTFMMVLLVSLCSACQCPFCMTPRRLLDAASIREL